MANFKTMSVKDAVKAHKIEDLDRTHLTTLDWGQIICLFNEETVGGGNYPVKANYFSRLAPLVKPTYGKAYFKTMSVFVPYYQVCDEFIGWQQGKTKDKGEITKSRYIRRRDILTMLNMAYISEEVSAADVATGSWYDYTYKDNATRKYHKLTNEGRYFVKVLNSLGYVIPQNANIHTSSTWWKGYGAKFISALPLLAFAKAYNDWMSQSQRFSSSIFTKLLNCVKHNKTISYGGHTLYDTSTYSLTDWGILTILDNINLTYENDYFTSAWQYPNAPIAGETYTVDEVENIITSTLYGNELVGGGESLINGQVGTNLNRNATFSLTADLTGEDPGDVSGTITYSIAQRSLDWLKAFANYVKRNNYSGSKDVNLFYSRMGIKAEEVQSNYAHIISKSSTPIQIGDVTALGQSYISEGNANNVELGDYAGKGIISGGEDFNYKASDYGMLMILGWITVAPMNVYGEDKAVKRVKPIDFYTPEFDGVGPEAISVDEVYTNPRIWSATEPNAVYGFTEKYNNYRYGKDRITGDFRRMPSDIDGYQNVGTEMNTWHLGRILDTLLTDGTLVAQNPAFNTMPQTDSEYNRVFSKTDGNQDHFYITAQFQCKAMLPMLNLNDVPGLGEGDTTVARNGNEIN